MEFIKKQNPRLVTESGVTRMFGKGPFTLLSIGSDWWNS